jgi:hypothetical protein
VLLQQLQGQAWQQDLQVGFLDARQGGISAPALASHQPFTPTSRASEQVDRLADAVILKRRKELERLAFRASAKTTVKEQVKNEAVRDRAHGDGYVFNGHLEESKPLQVGERPELPMLSQGVEYQKNR